MIIGNGRRIVAQWSRWAFADPRTLAGWVLLSLVVGIGIWYAASRIYGLHHLNAGKEALQHDRCRQALEHFQASLSVWPEDAQVLLLAARSARRLADLDLAKFYLSSCHATAELADEAALERVLLRATRGEIDEVGEYCRTLLAQDHPQSPLILEALAMGCIARLRYAEASAYLDRWLQESPDHPQALYHMGRLQLQAGNQDPALSLFRRVVELDPERDDARLFLAESYLDLGQAQEAFPHLELLRRRLPRNALVMARMARCLDLLGRQDESLRMLDDALSLQPSLVPALLERGKVALRDGDLALAEDLLRKACARSGANTAAHYQLQQCLERRGKTADAKVVLARLQQIERDIERLRDIAAVDLPQRPRDAALQVELGEIFLRAGAEEQGLRCLDGALELDPKNARAHRALAEHYRALGQTGQAELHRSLGGATDVPPKQDAPK